MGVKWLLELRDTKVAHDVKVPIRWLSNTNSIWSTKNLMRCDQNFVQKGTVGITYNALAEPRWDGGGGIDIELTCTVWGGWSKNGHSTLERLRVRVPTWL